MRIAWVDFMIKKIISVSEVSVDDHIISRQEPYQFMLTWKI